MIGVFLAARFPRYLNTPGLSTRVSRCTEQPTYDLRLLHIPCHLKSRTWISRVKCRIFLALEPGWIHRQRFFSAISKYAGFPFVPAMWMYTCEAVLNHISRHQLIGLSLGPDTDLLQRWTDACASAYAYLIREPCCPVLKS